MAEYTIIDDMQVDDLPDIAREIQAFANALRGQYDMTTPEQAVVNELTAFIKQQKRYDTFVHKSVDVPHGYPDLQGSWYGKPFAVEVKAPGRKARPEQAAWQIRLNKSGYKSGTVTTVDEFLALMEEPHPLDFIRRGKDCPYIR